jgi:outer membrane receptor for ferrienterochelin and colicin
MIISGERIRQTNSNNLLDALNGKVPGLNVSMNESGTVAKANIRGINSFNSDTTPLFVLDGFVVSSVNDIPLHDIDYVEVLKEGSFYGSRGANGAILIFTKTY